MDFKVTQAAIKRLLESELRAPDDHAWTLQGLGMLRMYWLISLFVGIGLDLYSRPRLHISRK